MSMENWTRVCALDDIPRQGSRVLAREDGDIALFRTHDDQVFALRDRCPHKGGPLSQGMVHGRAVACPLHGWNIDLASGEALAPDAGCARRFAARLESGAVWLAL